ncbi:MAG: hypothetical protein O7D34_05290 [Ignavibacteria bacterium]|nr:hypothetical protein [Ignavibacteria bacterium]
MALHDPVEDAQRAQEIPSGAIGAAIDDEQPSRAKQFFSDPKNLATMLVLASAMAQPRRDQRSVLAHVLRGGVGALAFRGGLDQAIQEQTQKDAEQRSIAEARANQATTEAAAVTATERRTTVQAETAEAGLESAADLQEARIEAGQFTKAPAAGGNFAERAVLQAQKDHSDAMLNWIALGRQGPPPEYGDALLRAAQSAAAVELGLENLAIEPLPEPGDTKDEATISGGVPEPSPTPPPPSPGEGAVITHKDLFAGHVPVVRQQKVANQKLRRDLPETFGDMSDEGITNTIQQINSEIANQLETMTEEEAKAILADPVKNRIMTKENFKAVRELTRKRARQKGAQRNLEAIGTSGIF